MMFIALSYDLMNVNRRRRNANKIERENATSGDLTPPARDAGRKRSA